MSLSPPVRHNWYERLLNLISVVKPGEGLSCVLMTINAAMLMAAYYLLKVIREPLILQYGGAEYKSYATAIQAGILILLVPVFSVLYYRFADSNIRCNIVNKVFLFFIINLLIFALLQHLNVNVGLAFYVWLGIFSVMVVAQFWAFAADSYNIRSGQRLFVIVAIGASLGAWLGSRIAGPLLPSIGIVGIMLMAASLLLVSVYLASRIEGTILPGSANDDRRQEESSVNHWLDGFSVVFKNNYLMLIACFVMLLVFINSTGEYIIARLVREESLALLADKTITDVGLWQGQFYSSYNSWITLASFVLQLFLVFRIFKWVGVRGALLVLPLVMVLSYSLILFLPIFSFIRLAMITENSVNYSVQTTTGHALFLPVPRRLKYLGKTTIETFFYRFGDLLYGGFIFFTTQYYPLEVTNYIAVNLFLALCLFILALRVGYLNVLERQKAEGNSPPKVMAMIPQLHMPSGYLSMFSISESTFVDPDIGDALKFRARQACGKPLPSWVKFDRMTRTFSFYPPQDHVGELEIEVIAADYEGLTATSQIRVTFFKQTIGSNKND